MNGFSYAGVTAGLKESGAPDVALVVNEGPEFSAAGVFTTNRVKAHPVVWSQHAVSTGQLRAIVLNSGNANAATLGGERITAATAQAVATNLGCQADDVAVCSTGVIGVPMDEDLICHGVETAVASLSPDGGDDAARAIMTTDTVPKTAHVEAGYHLHGFAKGAGMIAPGMATMLAVITTDASVDPHTLHEALSHAVEKTFNRIDVDGCMSTNDTVLIMANGASGLTPPAEEFQDNLTQVCQSLARAMIGDAEGASHDIRITVTSASDEKAALAVAKAVASSNLFKCAVYGNDPNWGRIISAVGTVDEQTAPFQVTDLTVSVNGVVVAAQGVDAGGRDLVDMSSRDVSVEIDLAAGDAEATIWTNDLTHDYIHENADYTT